MTNTDSFIYLFNFQSRVIFNGSIIQKLFNKFSSSFLERQIWLSALKNKSVKFQAKNPNQTFQNQSYKRQKKRDVIRNTGCNFTT